MLDFELVRGNSDNFIVFLHGFGGSKQSFYCVKNYIQGDYNLLFLSMSGFGDSPQPHKPFTVTDYANEVAFFIMQHCLITDDYNNKKDSIINNQICLSLNEDFLNKDINDSGRQIYLVCHSFGARVASKLCFLFPNLIDKLVIVDGAGLKPRRGLKYYLRVRKYKRLKSKVLRGKLDKSVLNNYGSSDYKSLSNVMKQTFVNVVNEDLKSYFKAIKIPTLIFWGELDKDTPLFMAKKLHRYIKNSGLIISKGSGHFSYLDDFNLFILSLNAFF